MVFKVSEAKEGVNYPVMHPRCRCTTTMNMDYSSRRARNPLTGRNYKVDGDMTYNEWIKSLTPEQKHALETTRLKESRKVQDKEQWLRYKKTLGTKVIPKSFDKFQDLKYNEPEKWESTKLSYGVISEIDKKNWHNSFKDKAKQTYFDFKNEGVEMSSHAISRYLPRKNGKQGISYSFNDIVKQSKMPMNYTQTDGRGVKYYNNVALVYNNKGEVIVSIVNRKHPKKDWREI